MSFLKPNILVFILISFLSTSSFASGVWTQNILKYSNPSNSNDAVGESMSSHGDWLVVGSTQYGNGNLGRVIIFQKDDDGKWAEHSVLYEQDLITSQGDLIDGTGYCYSAFGISVAIHNSTLVVGADWNCPANSYGAAFVYEYDVTSDAWNLVKTLGTEDISSEENNWLTYSGMIPRFGHSVDVYDDTILIGAPQLRRESNSNEMQYDLGVVFAYKKSSNGWPDTSSYQFAFLNDEEINGSHDRSYFGYSVCMGGDYIAIGGPRRGENANGSVHVFKRDAQSFVLPNPILVVDGDSYNRLGSSLACKDGYIVMGAPGVEISLFSSNQQTIAGKALVYKYNRGFGNAPGTVNKVQELSSFPEKETFGISVAIQKMQTANLNQKYMIAVGCLSCDYFAGDGQVFGNLNNKGRVYTYKFNQSNSLSLTKVLAAKTSHFMQSQGFGDSIALNRQDLFVGAPSAEYLYFDLNLLISTYFSSGNAFHYEIP